MALFWGRLGWVGCAVTRWLAYGLGGTVGSSGGVGTIQVGENSRSIGDSEGSRWLLRGNILVQVGILSWGFRRYGKAVGVGYGLVG